MKKLMFALSILIFGIWYATYSNIGEKKYKVEIIYETKEITPTIKIDTINIIGTLDNIDYIIRDKNFGYGKKGNIKRITILN
jgi:hypothetical protein